MKSKEISHEIIDVPVDTNVKFRTSTDPGSYIPMHWHRAVEIIYMQEGSLGVTVESESFTIQKGDCIVINGNVLHSTKCTSPECYTGFGAGIAFTGDPHGRLMQA